MLPFPSDLRDLPTLLFRKGDLFYKPYNVLTDNGSKKILCGVINFSEIIEFSSTDEMFDNEAILYDDFSSGAYVNMGPYISFKLLLDQAEINNSSQFFAIGFEALQREVNGSELP